MPCITAALKKHKADLFSYRTTFLSSLYRKAHIMVHKVCNIVEYYHLNKLPIMMLYSKIFNSVQTRSTHITYVKGARAKAPKQNQNCLIKETTAFKVFIADVCLFKSMKHFTCLSLVHKTLSSNCCSDQVGLIDGLLTSSIAYRTWNTFYQAWS